MDEIELNERRYPESFNASTKEVTAKLIDSVDTGKAMVFDICSDILSNPAADTHYGNPAFCENEGKHRYHAITATGYKCEGGRIKVLLQNSWGNTCSLPEAKPSLEAGQAVQANPLAECDYEVITDPTGQVIKRPSGKIWVDAEQLVKNSRGVQYFRP